MAAVIDMGIVGSADEDGDYGKGERATWSSTGATQDGFAKPDVMARAPTRPEWRKPLGPSAIFAPSWPMTRSSTRTARRRHRSWRAWW